MKIALIGYGKMGKAIEEIVLQRNHTAPLKIDINNIDTFTKENLLQCDVAIEFTGPHSAVENILKCLDAGIPVNSMATSHCCKFSLVKVSILLMSIFKGAVWFLCKTISSIALPILP